MPFFEKTKLLPETLGLVRRLGLSTYIPTYVLKRCIQLCVELLDTFWLIAAGLCCADMADRGQGEQGAPDPFRVWDCHALDRARSGWSPAHGGFGAAT